MHQYIGARYVPKFYENSDLTSEWRAGVEYEPLTIVTYNGNSYTSKKPVPASVGEPNLNLGYWVATGIFNEQLNELTDQVNEMQKSIPVTLEMFGANMQGGDDSQAVMNAFAYANEHNVAIEQHTGTLLLNFTVDVMVDCDFSGVTFIMDDNTPDVVFNIIHDDINYPTEALTLAKNSDIYPSNMYGMYCVPTLRDAQTSLGEKATGTGGEYYHRQPLMIDGLGNRMSAKYYLNSVNGAFVLNGFSSIMERGVTFRGGYVLVTTAAYRGFKQLVHIERNNCIVQDITCGYTILPTSGSANTNVGLIRARYCCNTIIENISGLNHSDSPQQSDPYVISIDSCFNTTIRNCTISQGWGIIAAYYCDTINYQNNIVNRFDVHYGLFGRTDVASCSFVGDPACILIGYGRGTLNISRCTGLGGDRFLGIREDLVESFDGVINISDCDCRNYTEVLRNSGYTGDSTMSTNLTLETLHINLMNCIMGHLSNHACYTAYSVYVRLDNCEALTACYMFRKTDTRNVRLNVYNSTFRNACNSENHNLIYFSGCTFYGSSNTLTAGGVHFKNCLFEGSSGSTKTINAYDADGSLAPMYMMSCMFSYGWDIAAYNAYVCGCFARQNTVNITYANTGWSDYNRYVTVNQAA